MPDTAHQRDAAGAFDRLRHGPARAHVVDHLRAGLPLEQRRREQRRREVARHELTRIVDEEAAVGVAVEGDTEVGALGKRLLDDEFPVLLEQRVRLVVREAPVRLEVAGHSLDRKPFEDRREHRSRHPIRGVDHYAQRPDAADVDEREDALDVGRDDVCRLDAPFLVLTLSLALGPVQSGQRAIADREQPRVTADR